MRVLDPEQKDFCTMLSEQLIDERKAVEDYELLLSLFDNEKELLLSDLYGPRKQEMVANLMLSIIKDIGDEEASHGVKLEKIRKLTCEATVS